MLPVHFLTDNHPLRGDDAVAAIITVEDGRYLMQLRDDIPRIFYPGHWGCFGGAVGPGEECDARAVRELEEELEMQALTATEFVTLDFDLTKLGQKQCYRTYYRNQGHRSRSSRNSCCMKARRWVCLAPIELFIATARDALRFICFVAALCRACATIVSKRYPRVPI